MKKLLVLFLLVILNVNIVSAYSIKVYDKQGKLVGKAVKNGEQTIIYDLNGNKLETEEQLYSPPGHPLEKDLELGSKYKIENFDSENRW